MTVKSPPEKPVRPPILEKLPNYGTQSAECPRRAKTQLDFIMLAVEALELNAAQLMLAAIRDLGLQDILKSRVHLWRLRSTNPLRKFNQRQPLSLEEAKALVLVVCYLCRKLTVLIRQLFLGYQQLQDKQLSLDHHFRLAQYLTRFRSHFRARMNPKRAMVLTYSTDEKLDELALSLLTQLLLCTGTRGEERLWTSLFDGEVS
ncbi:DUF3038 domain-containing protein [Leptothoe sp. PORK10 BA2]|uniref:DUF3038 domain-containing protein n=1 Tax=Leptothoe sp. PORK10 BA2 TaxID=3110254 RepID=UPI002B213E5B|nr:DUF3038 domain-containing protein [Leptothoe sp. PORK10 BA2]MEA5466526.1 DUF3038 domain-containing protein [Leptothoe sp. PORK10 BA2]